MRLRLPCDFACRVTAHAVGDDEEALGGFHERRVLVVVADHTDVGDEPRFESDTGLVEAFSRARGHEKAAINES
jgi:hypothetical protein